MSTSGPAGDDPYADLVIPPPEQESAEGGKSKDKGPTVAKMLVEMALEQYRLIRSADGRTYAVAKDGPALAIPLGSKKGLKFRLAASLYRRTGIVAGSSALSDYLTILEGEAAELPREPVYLRMGRTRRARGGRPGHRDRARRADHPGRVGHPGHQPGGVLVLRPNPPFVPQPPTAACSRCAN